MSVYQRTTKKDGKHYGARFRVMLADGSVVHKNLTPFKTKAEAREAEYEYRLSVANTPAPLSSNTTLNEVWERYRAEIIETLAPSSIYDYIKIYGAYIAPKFADSPITAITKKSLLEWQDSLPSEWRNKYREKVRIIFSNILKFAVTRDILSANPMTTVPKFKKRESKTQLSYWTKDEFMRFIDVVDNPLYRAFFVFLYASGCRKGEAFALKWSDVDFEAQTVSICKALSKKGLALYAQLGKEAIPTTKNRKTATIYMPKYSLDLIAKLPRGEYVFGCDKPLAETSVTRAFKHYIAESGVKPIRIHDLRHSCAALLISTSNAELSVLYAIAHRLRDTVEQILNTYGHLFPSKQDQIIKTFETEFNDFEKSDH